MKQLEPRPNLSTRKTRMHEFLEDIERVGRRSEELKTFFDAKKAAV